MSRLPVKISFIYHASMIHGDQREALVQACGLLNITPVAVD